MAATAAFVMGLFIALASVPTSGHHCYLDLVFVVDSSGSIRDNNPSDMSYDNWNLMKEFIVEVIDEMEIAPDAVHVGVVAFADIGQTIIKLGDLDNKSALKNAIRQMDYVGGNTNTSGGLRVMTEEQFNRRGGDRPQVRNVAIVLTDGKSTFDKERTISDAVYARNLGIDIYAVGITNAVDRRELKEMSSSPQIENQDYYTSPDFRELGTLVQKLADKACVKLAKCEDGVADVVFVIDSSGSIRDNNPTDGSVDNWQLMLSFVQDIVGRLNIGFDNTRVGVVIYSNYASHVFFLNQFRTKADVQREIQGLVDRYMGGTTNTSGGLRAMHFEQFTAKNGDRPNVDNIAIVITDGVSTVDETRTITDAQDTHADNIKVFALGITKKKKVPTATLR